MARGIYASANGTIKGVIEMEKIIEICCGSYYDAIQAHLGGAKRVELNSALHLGGLTPSIGTLRLVKKHTPLEVISRIRPRGAGFYYNDEDFEVLLEDCKLLMENGSDGISFGCLDSFGNIDIEKNRKIIATIKHYGGTAVFHRAFDCVDDPDESIQLLIDLGVDRLLTSGMQNKAMEGLEVLSHLQQNYGDKIQIIAGSGMNASNTKELMETTGIHQVYSSCKDWIVDPTTTALHVSYNYADEDHRNEYDVVNKKLVKTLLTSI